MTQGTGVIDTSATSSSSRLRAQAASFGRDYWIFLSAAFCMDLGFGLFFFLFNLYLADLHFNERVIGQIMACLTVGNLVGTIPAAWFARRKGVRPLLQFTFACTPLLCALRVLVPGVRAQLLLAFATGVALCGWPIGFSPTIARLTNEKNRALGFSIQFATGIGLGVAAGLAGGYLPQLLRATFNGMPLIGGIRAVLLLSCAVTLLGSLPLYLLRLEPMATSVQKQARIFHPFLLRFLPGFVLWSIVMGSFPMFGAVYLQNSLGIPLGKLGSVFSVSELMQFCAILLAPLLFRRVGTNKGIAIAQLGAACFLVLIGVSKSAFFAIGFYLLYFATQFMCEPGIYKMLMDSIPEAEQSNASAAQNICGAVCQAGTAAITGTCIVKFGYESVLLTDAVIAVLAALYFIFIGIETHSVTHRVIEGPEQARVGPGSAQVDGSAANALSEM